MNATSRCPARPSPAASFTIAGVGWSANITPDASGISYYNEDLFIRDDAHRQRGRRAG